MKTVRRLYRYCTCRHRLTIHSRGIARSGNDVSTPLVCEECDREKVPITDQIDNQKDIAPETVSVESA